MRYPDLTEIESWLSKATLAERNFLNTKQRKFEEEVQISG